MSILGKVVLLKVPVSPVSALNKAFPLKVRRWMPHLFIPQMFVFGNCCLLFICEVFANNFTFEIHAMLTEEANVYNLR